MRVSKQVEKITLNDILRRLEALERHTHRLGASTTSEAIVEVKEDGEKHRPRDTQVN